MGTIFIKKKILSKIEKVINILKSFSFVLILKTETKGDEEYV